MFNITNGEAMPAERPSLPKLLQLLKLWEAKMNLRDRDTPEAEADEIETQYHKTIGAIVDRKTVCTNTKDALAALRFIRDEFDGESSMADRLVRAVIEWVRTLSFEKLSLIDIQAELERRLDGLDDRINENVKRVIEMDATVNGVVAIAKLAVEVDRYAAKEKIAKAMLRYGYGLFKERRQVAHVERDTPDWQSMMEYTKLEYEELRRAKRNTQNARRRLSTAIRHHRNLGKAHVEAEVAE